MSKPTNITEWLQGLPIPWLVGGTNGRADATALGTVVDAQIARLKAAVKCRMPTVAPSDAVPHIGNERQMPQAASESNSAYAARLKTDAWVDWALAGTPVSLLLALYYATDFSVSAQIVQQNGLAYSFSAPPSTTDPTSSLVITNEQTLSTALTPTPPNAKTIPAGSQWFTLAGNDQCNRFGVFMRATLPTGWGAPVDPPTAATAPTLNQVNAIRYAIATWKPAKSICTGIYVNTSGKMWGYPLTQVWGAATGNYGGTSVVFSP